MALTVEEKKAIEQQRKLRQADPEKPKLKKLTEDEAQMVREAIRRNRPVYDSLADREWSGIQISTSPTMFTRSRWTLWVSLTGH